MQTRTPFTAIRLHDPAIDWRAVDASGPDAAAKYAMERDVALIYDPKADVNLCHPGDKPVIFTCRRLTRPQVQKFVSSATTDEDRWVKSFQCGVVRIEFPDGTVYEPEWITRGALCMSEKDLVALEEAHGFETNDILDIGMQISRRSDVPFDCTPSFPVPPWSVHAWAVASLRSAERSRAAALLSNSEAKAPSP
jgi:hypothetical protein